MKIHGMMTCIRVVVQLMFVFILLDYEVVIHVISSLTLITKCQNCLINCLIV